jgi:hypothetical protein
MEIIIITIISTVCIVIVIQKYFNLRIKDRDHKLKCSFKVARAFENKTPDEAEAISKMLKAFNSYEEIKLPRLPGKEL